MKKRVLAGVLLLAALPCCRDRFTRRATLSIALPFRVDTLDPHAVNSLSYFAIASHLYEALVTTDADMRIEPWLARRWESPDAKTWVFHLQPGVRFHRGEEMTASDVVYSLNRVLHDPGLEMGGFLVRVKEVREVDPLTVRIETSLPASLLLAKLRFVAIVPRGSTAATLSARPDGTGPYRFASWSAGRQIRLVRNEEYWREKPAYSNVEIRFGLGAEEAARELTSGRVQIALCNSKSRVARLEAERRWQILRRPNIFLKFLGFDLGRERTPYASTPVNPFRDLRVRRAINLGIDRARLVRDLSVFAVPAGQLVPSFIHGYNPAVGSVTPDPEAARRLLAEAGFANGLSVRMDVRSLYSEAAELVARQLSSIGIDAKVEKLESRLYFERMDARDTSFFLAGIGCPTGDISDVLDYSFHSPDPAKHFGVHNFTGYANPAVDSAIEKSSAIESLESRLLSLQKIEAMLMDDLVWIPLYTDEDVYAVSREVRWRPRADSMVLAAEAAPTGLFR